ncbi:MAG: asparagine synthase C-terminal domain-containing protein, partial [Chloroflexota bacterium]
WANAYLHLPGLLTRRIMPSIIDLLHDRADKPVGASLVNGLKRLDQLTRIDRRASILRWGSYFSPDQRRSLWRREFWQETEAHNAEEWLITRYDELPENAGPLDRTLNCDVNTYLPGDLLVKADRMSMAASLEARSPFLDYQLVEWAARLPENLKIHGRQGKHLLKHAFSGYLPAEVLHHRKQGFGIPLGAWFRGPLADWATQTLLGGNKPLARWFNTDQIETILDEHNSGHLDHGKRIWALVMLSLWLEG